LRLYANLGNPRATKILAVAAAAEVKVELVHTEIANTKTKEFLAKNPNGKVPVLEVKEGVTIYESNAILRYIGRLGRAKGLVGANEIEEAQVDQWLDWTATELEPTLWKRLGPVFGWAPFDEETNKKAGQDNMKLLQILNTHFATHQHLVGNRTTIADIHVASSLTLAFKFLFEEKYRKSFANLTKWYEAFSQESFFVQAFGKVRLCVTQLPHANVVFVPHGHAEKKPAEKKQEAPKKEEKPKAEKKPKKDDDDEDDEPKEKKEANPLDALPPSTFNLFDFKTLFVNAPDKKVATKFFFDNFDKAGYSIYHAVYNKDESVGKVLFLTNNLMKSPIQKLEDFRKYSFAVHGVYGEEPNLEIKGVWVWRGVGIPERVKEELDLYTLTPLDIGNEADRHKVEDYWTHLNDDEDVVEGLKVRTAVYFK